MWQTREVRANCNSFPRPPVGSVIFESFDVGAETICYVPKILAQRLIVTYIAEER